MSTDEFVRSPQFGQAVAETVAGLHWLESLLGDHRRWVAIRDTFSEHTSSHTGAAPAQREAQCRFLGEGKRWLFQLCELLERDRRPATREQVVRSLEADLVHCGGTRADPTAALDHALAAGGDSRRQAWTPAPLQPTAPPLSLESLSLGPAPLASRTAPARLAVVELARQQQHFYDDIDETPTRFLAGPTYEPARRELFLLFQRLKSLLPSTGPEKEVADLVGRRAQAWVGHERNFKEGARAQLFGVGKRLTWHLCEALETDPRPETRALACRHLREAFRDPLPRQAAIAALDRALSDVLDAGAATATAAAAAGASPARAPVPGTMPKPASPAFATILGCVNPDEFQRMHQHLREGIDRLARQFGKAASRSAEESRCLVTEWRRSCEQPPSSFGEAEAQMLCTGPLVLNRLCDELDQMNVACRGEFLSGLKPLVQEHGTRWRVPVLVTALIEAERRNASASSAGPRHAGLDNPHLDERRARFEEWARPLMRTGRLTDDQVSSGLETLGLYQPDIVVDGPLPQMDAASNNAAWRVCLEGATAPDHPFADPGLWRLAETLAALRGSLLHSGWDVAKDLDAFEARWVRRTPSGTPTDPVGKLREIGVPALERVLDRAKGRDGQPARLDVLARLVKELAAAEDPTPVLLRHARHEGPGEPMSAARRSANH